MLDEENRINKESENFNLENEYKLEIKSILRN